MTVPAPPLPDVRDLIAACVPRSFSDAPWTHGDATLGVATYRLGRYALAAAVQALIRRGGASRLVLFVPDYICNEALERIRSLPVELRFYAIDLKLAPDWAELERNVAASDRPTALILVDYFGFPNDWASALAFCRRHDIFLIDDAAHVLRPFGQAMHADVTVYSAHKLFPVGSCAVLVSKREVHDYLPPQRPSRVRLETLRWMAARLTQKFMIFAGLSWHSRWKDDGGRLPPRPASKETAADGYSQSLLEVTVKQTKRVAELRRHNYSTLIEGLRDVPGVRPLFPVLGDADCPYVLPLRAAEIGAEKLSVALLHAGVPALRWPSLPPEVVQEREGHAAAKSLFDQVVLLPVHQSLLPDHIETMKRCVRDAVERLRVV
jgi:hypothetical protein